MSDDTTRHDPGLDETQNLPAIPAPRTEAHRIVSRQHVPAGASVVIPSGQYPAAFGAGYPPANGYGYGGAPMQHPAYNPFLPDYLAPLYHHEQPLQLPLLLETIRRYHLWQAPACIAYSALGWWTHSEPMHTWLMLPFLTGGVALPVGAYLAHHAYPGMQRPTGRYRAVAFEAWQPDVELAHSHWYAEDPVAAQQAAAKLVAALVSRRRPASVLRWRIEHRP